MANWTVLVAVFCMAVAGATAGRIQNKVSDTLLNTPQLIRKYGYPAEVYSVTTEDGYVLEMHRIPYSPLSPEAPNKPVVFMQHGALSASSDWILMGPNKGLGYILADLGYDVWLGNSRGNTYSRKHLTLDPDNKTSGFWDFSWHEMGVYDLPVMIDFALSTTGAQDVIYVGHSQGTTQFYVLTSEKPEYNDKIRTMFSLGTAVFNTHGNNPLLDIIADATDPEDLENLLGIGEFLPHSDLLVLLGSTLCSDTSTTQDICENIIFLIVGFDEPQMNKTMLPVILAHTPAGSSTKQMIHYTQGTFSQKFAQYNHGEAGNMAIYGTPTPPEYDLSKVTTPVHIHYSLNDLATVENIDVLVNALPNVVGKFLVPLPEFNHVDFVWAIDVKTLLYDLMIEQMADFL